MQRQPSRVVSLSKCPLPLLCEVQRHTQRGVCSNGSEKQGEMPRAVTLPRRTPQLVHQELGHKLREIGSSGHYVQRCLSDP
jgi:hypothetical protein